MRSSTTSRAVGITEEGQHARHPATPVDALDQLGGAEPVARGPLPSTRRRASPGRADERAGRERVAVRGGRPRRCHTWEESLEAGRSAPCRADQLHQAVRRFGGRVVVGSRPSPARAARYPTGARAHARRHRARRRRRAPGSRTRCRAERLGPSTATLRSTCGTRVITDASSENGRPRRAMMSRSTIPVSVPSPVVAWQLLITWPDCSPPRTRSRRSSSSRTLRSPTGVRRTRCRTARVPAGDPGSTSRLSRRRRRAGAPVVEVDAATASIWSPSTSSPARRPRSPDRRRRRTPARRRRAPPAPPLELLGMVDPHRR